MSTFQMEMTETANILSFASARSFVILDEIGNNTCMYSECAILITDWSVGRGTSTLEGLAIAQATMEHIHDNIGLLYSIIVLCHLLSVQAVGPS